MKAGFEEGSDTNPEGRDSLNIMNKVSFFNLINKNSACITLKTKYYRLKQDENRIRHPMFWPDHRLGSQEQTMIIRRYIDLDYKERGLAHSHNILEQRVIAIEYPSLSIISIKTPTSKEKLKEKVKS